MKINTRFWLIISLLNLLIVALLGTVMRYKIGFNFPYLDQKHLQHAHSHFAFIGWITHTLFVLMADVLQKDHPTGNFKYHNKLILLNLFCSYGMVIAFAMQGYGLFSISFSTLAVFTSYLMAARLFKDLKTIGQKPYSYWFTAAMWFNVISSIGTFTLAFMMASHNFNSNIHLGALYFYLHFQYNGFFTFACFGLFLANIHWLMPGFRADGRMFTMFFLSCIPAYFLSTLWAKLPDWLYIIVIIAAAVQCVAWFWFLRTIAGRWKSAGAVLKKNWWIFLLLAFSLSVKYLLQLGSVVPEVSKLAFGFRPIVIAYLHLILLAIISVFLLCYINVLNFLQAGKLLTAGLFIFVAGVYLNELVLGVQGIAAFSYTIIPYVNEMLFGVAVLILLSVGLLFFSQFNTKAKRAQ